MDALENVEESGQDNASASTGISPTSEVYAELERAYSFFNTELFDGRLPPCMITLQRANDSLGYFSADRFVKRNHKGAMTHEIALNPSYFAIRSIPETLSVLVREMLSLDQYLHSAKPSRRRYRNKEWADMAESVGLMPSVTGLPGGKRTGETVLVYIIDGGRFDVACSKLLDDQFVLSWLDRYPPAEKEATPAQESAQQQDSAIAPHGLDGDKGSASEGETDDAGFGGLTMASDAESPDQSLLEGSWEGDHQPAGAETSDTSDTDGMAVPEGQGGVTTASEAPPMKTFARVDVDTLAESGIEPREKPKNSSKSKFNCKVCKANVWGRPSLRVLCEGTEEEQHEPASMVLIG